MIIITRSQASCLKTASYNEFDLLLFAIIGLGMLVPAWLLASFVQGS